MFYLKIIGIVFLSQSIFFSSAEATNWFNSTNLTDSSLDSLALKLVDPKITSSEHSNSVAQAGFIVELLTKFKPQIQVMPNYEDRFTADCYTSFAQSINGVNCSFDFADTADHIVELGLNSSNKPSVDYTNPHNYHEFFSKTFVNWKQGKSLYAMLTSLYPRVSTTLAPTPAPSTSVPTTAIPATAVPTTSAPTTAIPATSVPTTGVPTTAAPTTARTVAASGVDALALYKNYSYYESPRNVPALEWELGRKGTTSMTFSQAQAYAASKASGGWRLPTIWELYTLYNQRAVLGADLDTTTYFWSGSAVVGNPIYHWGVDFDLGNVDGSSDGDMATCVWCVADGKTF